MKRLLFAFLLGALFLPFQAEASHILGGDIQYKYVGDSTGVTGQYRIKLVIYREQSGVGLGTAQTVTINAPSCNLTTNVTCSFVSTRVQCGLARRLRLYSPGHERILLQPHGQYLRWLCHPDADL